MHFIQGKKKHVEIQTRQKLEQLSRSPLLLLYRSRTTYIIFILIILRYYTYRTKKYNVFGKEYSTYIDTLRLGE